MKKKKKLQFFWLEESCAKQHRYQGNQFQNPQIERKQKIAKWHLLALACCTS